MKPAIRSLIAVASIGFGCSACVSNSRNQQQAQLEELPGVTLTAAQRQAVKDGVKVNLKDPDSAQFGGYKAGRAPNGSIAVCGYVNSKNSFGGYVGMTPFVVKLEGATVSNVVLDTADRILGLYQACEQMGLDLGQPRKATT